MLHVRTDVASECVDLRIQNASGRTRDQSMMRDSGRGHPMGDDGASNRTLGVLETESRRLSKFLRREGVVRCLVNESYSSWSWACRILNWKSSPA